MSRTLFINLPVADVNRSQTFYEAIGATNEPAFSNESAKMMRFSSEIAVMLLSHDFYRTFTTKRIADTHATSAALLCLSFDDRAGVDRITEAAIAGGGRETREAQDQGFMYGRAFEDLDGHVFEPMYMDMDAALAAFAATPEVASA